MSRSKWKGPFIKKNKSKISKKTIKNIVMSRDSYITPNFNGLTFDVHNGKIMDEVKVTKDMIGHKFGEFSFTRQKFSYKKKNK